MTTQSISVDQLIVLPDTISPYAQFREMSKSFLRDCRYRNLASTTIDFYKFHLQAFEHFMAANDLELMSLEPFDLNERMIHYMMDQNLAVNTMNGRIRTCRGFFRFLWEDGLMNSNLAVGLKTMKAQNQMLFTFTDDQVYAVLANPIKQHLQGCAIIP